MALTKEELKDLYKSLLEVTPGFEDEDQDLEEKWDELMDLICEKMEIVEGEDVFKILEM